MRGPDGYTCPACRARFRGAGTCSRCGADLEVLMRLAAQAHRDRHAARQLLREGRFHEAAGKAVAAEGLCATRAGRRLWLLARWLEASEAGL